MRSKERKAFTEWAIAYCDNPSANPSRTSWQALALLIHDKMQDGEWRTANAIANELKLPIGTVQRIMQCVKDAWGYEAIPSRNKGYRRKTEC